MNQTTIEELDNSEKELARKILATKLDGVDTIFDVAKNNGVDLTVKTNFISILGIKSADFYQKLLIQKNDVQFRQELLKVCRMDSLVNTFEEAFEEVLQQIFEGDKSRLKLDRLMLKELIDLLDIPVDFKNRNETQDPNYLLTEIKNVLTQRKEHLTRQVEEKLLQERQAHELKEQQERDRVRQAPKIGMLSEIHFDAYLKIIHSKAQKYQHSSRVEDKEATGAANTLHTTLINTRDKLLRGNGPTKTLFKEFKDECLNAIDASRYILEQHRGWKQILAHFTSAVVSIMSLGIANYSSGKGFFGLFRVQTDSHQQLNSFEKEINYRLT